MMIDILRYILNRLRSVARFFRRVIAFTLMYLSSVKASFRNQSSYIVDAKEGELSLEGTAKVAIYVHFDAQGRVHRYVLHQLQELKQLGFGVVFVTNSPMLTESSMASLPPLVARVIRRDNVGYDFGAYKDAILSLDNINNLEQLLLMNDSVYGPFQPLDQVLAQAACDDSDVLAMTDSWELKFHLQSYFLLFKTKAITDPRFVGFWEKLRYVDNKNYVIRYYEVGLTQLLLAAEMKCKALYPYETVAKLSFAKVRDMNMHSPEFYALSKLDQDYFRFLKQSLDFGTPVNGSHFFWETMMSQMRYPYIKRELLTKNPMKVPGLIRVNDLIAEQGSYDVSMISDHMQVLNNNRLP